MAARAYTTQCTNKLRSFLTILVFLVLCCQCISQAKYRAGINFPELHIRPQNITANLPSNIVHVQKGSCIQLLIRGTPKLLPPSSLAVTAYSATSGAAAKVLNATDYDSSIFRINLNHGNYILLATATWLPGSEDVTGYVIYKFVVSVV